MRLDVTVPPWARAVVSDLTDMHRTPHGVDAARVSRYALELPDDVYFEYAFLDQYGRMRADPEREALAENPWYPEVTAVRGPDHAHHPLSDPPAPARPGTTTRHRVASEVWQGDRRALVYTPAGTSGPLPMVLFHDGMAYFRVARTPDVYEALRAAGEVDDALLVFVDSVDREREYAYDPRHARFVLDDLLPFLGERHDVGEEIVAAGASLGGLAAALVALASLEGDAGVRTVLTQGGAFLGSPEDPRFHRVEHAWLPGELAQRDLGALRWWSEVGTLDWLCDVNREVHAVLGARAGEHAYAERSAGHNWRSWRDGLPEGLRFALRPGR